MLAILFMEMAMAMGKIINLCLISCIKPISLVF